MKIDFVGTRPFSSVDEGIGSSTPTTASGSPSGGERIFVTDIAVSVSGTPLGIVKILDGSTTIWKMELPNGSGTPFSIAVSFEVPLIGTANQKVHLQVEGGSGTPTGSYANLIGLISKN